MLTIREWSVLSCRERGLSNKAAAAELGISIHTVKNHVAKILRKTGTGSCLEALYKLKSEIRRQKPEVRSLAAALRRRSSGA